MSRAKKVEKESAKQATGKHPRDDDEGLVAYALVGKRKALEEAYQSVMGMGQSFLPLICRHRRSSLLVCGGCFR